MLQGSRRHAETSLYPLRSVELEMILGMMHLYSSHLVRTSLVFQLSRRLVLVTSKASADRLGWD